MTRVAAAVLAALMVAGCGNGKDSRRSAVDRYIASVNQIERDAAAPWNRARTAYIALARGTLTARQRRVLDKTPGTIRTLRTRIAGTAPPEDARRLHAALLRLLDLNARFAAEVVAFARYVDAVGPLEKRLAAETAGLRRSLKRARTGPVQQLALAAYAAHVDALVAAFRRLDPPRVLAPWHEDQVARFVTLRDGAAEVRAGLARHDRLRAEHGLTALTGVSATSSATVADRRAVLAYNDRLRQVRAAAAAVAGEQKRLARELT